MKLSLLGMLLFITSAWAQPDSVPAPLGQLKAFLDLSDAQIQSILANSDDYNRLSYEKQRRIYQVQDEILAETAKEPLDPPALGIRYAEVEAICRELKERAKTLRTRNLEALNQGQKAKLGVLEEAIRLAPVVSQARGANLVGDIPQAPYAFNGNSSDLITSLLSPVFGGLVVPGCHVSGTPPWFDTSAYAVTGNPPSFPLPSKRLDVRQLPPR